MYLPLSQAYRCKIRHNEAFFNIFLFDKTGYELHLPIPAYGFCFDRNRRTPKFHYEFLSISVLQKT